MPKVLTISFPIHDWLLELQQWYASDADAKALLAKLSVQTDPVSPFSLRNGLVMFKQRIWLGSNKALQNRVLAALHNSPVGGHSGAPVTYQKIRQLFYWPAMRKDILRFVQACTVCAQAKPDRIATRAASTATSTKGLLGDHLNGLCGGPPNFWFGQCYPGRC